MSFKLYVLRFVSSSSFFNSKNYIASEKVEPKLLSIMFDKLKVVKYSDLAKHFKIEKLVADSLDE